MSSRVRMRSPSNRLNNVRTATYLSGRTKERESSEAIARRSTPPLILSLSKDPAHPEPVEGQPLILSLSKDHTASSSAGFASLRVQRIASLRSPPVKIPL